MQQPLKITASDVRYDLRIWRLVDGGSLDVVYERLGLRQTEHVSEKALEANTEYVWGVRPRFLLNGRPRALRWSAGHNPDFSPAEQLVQNFFFTAMDGQEASKRYCTEDAKPNSRSADQWWNRCYCLDFIPAENGYSFRTP